MPAHRLVDDDTVSEADATPLRYTETTFTYGGNSIPLRLIQPTAWDRAVDASLGFMDITVLGGGKTGVVTTQSPVGLIIVNTDTAATYLSCGADGVTFSGGATIARFEVDGTLADNSDYYVPTQKAVKTYVDTQAPTVSTGTAAPATTPTKVGDIFVDTTNKKLYFATGTTNSSDWTIAN